MKFRDLLGLTFVSGSLLVAHPQQAQACGGCFHQVNTNMSTVVTGHRMAFAFSSTRTVLWDQIRYTGSPADFSWVLPVKGDVKLESAEDAWFDSLEAVSNTVTTPPQLNCYVPRNGGGCDCGSSSSLDSAPQAKSAGGFASGTNVTVLNEDSVGPYKYVQLRATDSQSLLQWLADNMYAIPADVRPVIDAYQSEGFDFIALRLAPRKDVRQMTPIRVITPGASPTLPLRMVAAGTGDFVGITLYVIAEGRYEAAGFNNKVNVDFSQLSWDWHSTLDTTQGESNYGALRLQALAAGDGKNWLTSFAARQGFTKKYSDALGVALLFSPSGTTAAVPGGRGFGVPTGPTFDNLADLYLGQANGGAADAGFGGGFGGGFVGGSGTPSTGFPTIRARLDDKRLVVDDACSPIDPVADAGTAGDASPCQSNVTSDQQRASGFVVGDFSDIAAAMIGMHPKDVWITRLEANLPHAALAADLKITPAAAQSEVSTAHRAVQHVNPPCDLLENHDVEIVVNDVSSGSRTQQAGLGSFAAVGLLLARRAARRRARRSRR